MKYLSLNTVAKAYEDNKAVANNKFWGVLSLFYAADKEIKRAQKYSISKKTAGDFLNGLFDVSDTPSGKSSEDSTVFFIKKNLDNFVAEQLTQTEAKKKHIKPNIYSIACWFFRSEEFDSELSKEDLALLLLEKCHLSAESAKSLFSYSDISYLSYDDKKYSASDLRVQLGLTSATFISALGEPIKSAPAEFRRSPFLQTLVSASGVQEYISFDNASSSGNASASDSKNMQKIFFGTPGAGKSYNVTEIIDKDIKAGFDVKVVRTVFHPDSDFSSFVGSYKPIMKQGTFYQPDGTPVPGINVEKISYEFVPQAFMQAYKLAWENPETHVYLVIEEINRGNCAQIFGELFQLLDRKDGFSEYPISANSDFQEYLSKINPDANGLARLSTIISDIEAKGIYLEGAAAGKTPKELFCKFLCLPDNLYILATMNTSDQSLFPMDSAFKRRWDMEYVEIKYEGSGKDSDNFEFVVNGQHYYWIKFLKRINELIYDATESEDKQMGNFFMKSPVISEEAFKSKVMFYLWEEVCKDLGKSSKNFYKIAVDSGIERFTFNDLYKDETRFLEGGKVINGKRVLELFLDRIDDKKEFRVTPAPAAATAVTPPTAPATGTAATTPASPATGSGN